MADSNVVEKVEAKDISPPEPTSSEMVVIDMRLSSRSWSTAWTAIWPALGASGACATS